ncbi:AMP-binding protein [Streptomyces sp. NBC_00523]|uniref:AMP-binding protein n=1 Tax=unclassified Streptomyces TaxID=2593676 RepID=UPI002E817A8B|nr:AMP-binding protein [Streptomyces sp. NBC_00523]WUD01293.1 AMP-binding protein [Streptomyces sp. NBC_00523]
MTEFESAVHRVERIAGTFPEHVALEAGGRRLTYRALWRLAGAIACSIRERHGRVLRVGLCASRSITAYAGYLAILRLGATVVPMNPVFPAARNVTIAVEGEVDVVLVDAEGEALTEVLHAAGKPVLVAPEDGAEDFQGATAEPDEFAYVLFTSGSTGKPKGVPVSHRSVASYLDHIGDRYELGPGCRLSQTFDLTFDPSVFDLFATWTSGATLVVPTARDLLTPTLYVAREEITHWYSVPSAVSFAQRVRALEPGAMPSLRYSVFIGEPFTHEQARAWAEAAPDSVIENVYGPTELTVSCTEYRLPRSPTQWRRTRNGTVPIGSVYPALEHVLLDEDGRPADEGELCVRGPQRFPGYLDATHNEGRFLTFDGVRAELYEGPGPLTEEHWYRTGDRIRRADSGLIHLGRLDRQVKLRGYRVELGEIEGALRTVPAVADAAVLVRDRRLYAFHTGEPIDGQALRRAIGHRLPAYMLPDETHWVEALPLSANGKVDYAALRVLEGSTLCVS